MLVLTMIGGDDNGGALAKNGFFFLSLSLFHLKRGQIDGIFTFRTIDRGHV